MSLVEPTRVVAPSVAAVPDPSPAARPERRTDEGRYAIVEPLDPSTHADALFTASHGDPERERIWDYLPYGPFASAAEFRAHLAAQAASEDPLFFAIQPRASDRVEGGWMAKKRSSRMSSCALRNPVRTPETGANSTS